MGHALRTSADRFVALKLRAVQPWRSDATFAQTT
jgi:hypothetical protein